MLRVKGTWESFASMILWKFLCALRSQVSGSALTSYFFLSYANKISNQFHIFVGILSISLWPKINLSKNTDLKHSMVINCDLALRSPRISVSLRPALANWDYIMTPVPKKKNPLFKLKVDFCFLYQNEVRQNLVSWLLLPPQLKAFVSLFQHQYMRNLEMWNPLLNHWS